jgi:hypothetical protein
MNPLNNFPWSDEKVIDFVNWFLKLHKIDDRFQLENQTIIDSFKNGDSYEAWWEENCNLYYHDPEPFLKDKYGNHVEKGSIIKWNRFYWEEGSSEDWFGTEPQVSFPVMEAYLETIESEVYPYLGELCIDFKGTSKPIKQVLFNQSEAFDFFIEKYNGTDHMEMFLAEGVYDDHSAKIKEVKILLFEFEIIKERTSKWKD